MMKDAEAHAEEDRKRRERGRDPQHRPRRCSSPTEKFLAENGDKLPADKKAELEAALEELKKTLEGADFDAIKAAQEKLSPVSSEAGGAMYAAAAAGGADGAGRRLGPSAPADDDAVVDAEVVDEGPSRGAPK